MGDPRPIFHEPFGEAVALSLGVADFDDVRSPPIVELIAKRPNVSALLPGFNWSR